MAERKLATIQKIISIDSIKGADFIVKARVMGWDVVVKKDEFQEGDMCCFCEVDSILPDGQPWAEFMRPRKFRVKTIRLKKVLSQGLALPLSILPEQYIEDCKALGPHGPVGIRVGDDVTEVLGIKKYEIPEHNGGAKMGQSAGSFPHYVPKTDEIRVQSALRCLDELKGLPYYITLKCDGTSGTFVKYEDEFLACSRNWAKKDDETNVYWAMVHKYDLDKLIPEGFAVQGEIVGPGIQANRLILPEVDLRVFTVYDINARRRVEYKELVKFCEAIGVPMVPVLEEGEAFDYNLEQLLEKARGKYEGTKNHREGLVIRPQVNTYSQKLQGPLSIKAINNDFLLKGEA